MKGKYQDHLQKVIFLIIYLWPYLGTTYSVSSNKEEPEYYLCMHASLKMLSGRDWL